MARSHRPRRVARAALRPGRVATRGLRKQNSTRSWTGSAWTIIVFGEASAPGVAWADELIHQFRHDGYEAGRYALREIRRPLRGVKRAEANRLLNYVTERQEMIRYVEFESRGWQVGSGRWPPSVRSWASWRRSGSWWTRTGN